MKAVYFLRRISICAGILDNIDLHFWYFFAQCAIANTIPIRNLKLILLPSSDFINLVEGVGPPRSIFLLGNSNCLHVQTWLAFSNRQLEPELMIYWSRVMRLTSPTRYFTLISSTLNGRSSSTFSSFVWRISIKTIFFQCV